jgi:DNA-binding transcriptional LysR family regulator
MESFVRVVRSGSFTTAANQLGLSRALISRHVGDLERRLGVRLLNRSTRALHLTEEGRAYLAFCETLFRDMESQERSIVLSRTEPAGTLKLMTPKSFGTLHLADAIIDFARAQPRMKVLLLLENTSFRSYEFAERGLDLALRFSPMRNASMATETVAELEWVLCASPDYLARHGRPVAPADLARHTCLVHLNTSSDDHLWRFEGPRGKAAVRIAGSFYSNSALALRKAALASLGIALLPRYSVIEDLASGMLVPVLPRYRVPSRTLLAVYPRVDAVPKKVQVFVDFLRAWMATRDVGRTSSRLPDAASRPRLPVYRRAARLAQRSQPRSME